MPNIPFKLPPGQLLNGTEYDATNRWRAAQLIRFYNGSPMPIGGWKLVPLTIADVPATGLEGSCRAVTTWRANNQQQWAAFGTTRKLYAFDGGTFTDITPHAFVEGTDNVAVGLGYGAGQYGKENYGVERSAAQSGIVSEPGRWTLDTYGEQLVCVANSDGIPYVWDLITSTAEAIANAPVNCRSLVVTNERMLMLLGAGDGPPTGGLGAYTPNPRHVWWCSQENLTDWDTTSPTNTAGDFDLDTSGNIMFGTRFAGDIYIFTDQDLHRCQYLGPPYIYGFHKLSDGCGVVGPAAVCATANTMAWMGTNGFFMYDGYVRPLDCEVLDFLLKDINKLQQAKVYAGHNVAFNEIWWYYPSNASDECDSYVVWNYAKNHWLQGRLARTAWTDANVWPHPLAARSYVDPADGKTRCAVYQHEQDYLDDSVARGCWIESGPIELSNGDRRMVVQRVYQDFDASVNVDAFSFTFKTRNAPQAPEESYGPYVIDTSRGYTDVRLNARQIVMRIDEILPQRWIAGKPRLVGVPSSMR